VTAVGNDLVAGTSVECPGGANPIQTEAELLRIDWASRSLAFHTVPVPGSRDIVSLLTAPSNLVYGLASPSTFFVFDPEQEEISHVQDWSAHGVAPRHALQRSPAGEVYALMSQAIVRIDPVSFDAEVVDVPPEPVTAGGALVNDTFVYASNSHVWTYGLPQP
jgi:streptogramin lyase